MMNPSLEPSILIAGSQPVYSEGIKCILQNMQISSTAINMTLENFLQNPAFDFDYYFLDFGSSCTVQMLDSVCRPLLQSNKRVVLFVDFTAPSKLRDVVMTLGVHGVIPKNMNVNLVMSALQLIMMGGRYIPDAMLHGANMNMSASGFAESQMPYGGGGYGSDPSSPVASLTMRQKQVLLQLGKGRSNQEIADTLGISVATVKLHVNAVLQSLRVKNRTEAALVAVHNLYDIKADLASDGVFCEEDEAHHPHQQGYAPVGQPYGAAAGGNMSSHRSHAGAFGGFGGMNAGNFPAGNTTPDMSFLFPGKDGNKNANSLNNTPQNPQNPNGKTGQQEFHRNGSMQPTTLG